MSPFLTSILISSRWTLNKQGFDQSGLLIQIRNLISAFHNKTKHFTFYNFFHNWFSTIDQTHNNERGYVLTWAPTNNKKMSLKLHSAVFKKDRFLFCFNNSASSVAFHVFDGQRRFLFLLQPFCTQFLISYQEKLKWMNCMFEKQSFRK